MKIAFVFYGFSSFVRQDRDIIARHFEIEEIQYYRLRDIFKIMICISKSDLSFSWFAGGHSFLAVLFSKLFRKKSIIVAGGYDVACVSGLNYGQFTNSFLRRSMTTFALKYADLILPVSEFTQKETLRWATPRKNRVIFNGIDLERYKPGLEKEELVITVGGVNRSNLRRKGLETFVKSARIVPEARFVVIGKEQDESINMLRSLASPNVTFAGYVSEEELLGWYQRAKVYVQVSAYESFGMSLAESMLCECVPVVTDKGALPEVVGDTGFYVAFEDETDTARGICEALRSNKGASARKRIENLFPLQKREKALIESIEALIR